MAPARRVPLFAPHRTGPGLVTLTAGCTCREPVTITVTEAEWLSWLRGPDDPALAPEIILLLATGMHPACIEAVRARSEQASAA